MDGGFDGQTVATASRVDILDKLLLVAEGRQEDALGQLQQT
jgi:hypothetical protein